MSRGWESPSTPGIMIRCNYVWGSEGWRGTSNKLCAKYAGSQTHCGCRGATPDKFEQGSTNHCCYLLRDTLLSNLYKF